MESEFTKNLKITGQGFFRRLGVQLVVIYIALVGFSATWFTYHVVQTQTTQLTSAITQQAVDKARAIAVTIRSLISLHQQGRIDEFMQSFDGDKDFVSLELFNSSKKLVVEHHFGDSARKSDPQALFKLEHAIPKVSRRTIEVDELKNHLR